MTDSGGDWDTDSDTDIRAEIRAEIQADNQADNQADSKPAEMTVADIDWMKLFRLEGSTALVTGGGRGLGAFMARALAAAGAQVAVCSRQLDACEEVAAGLRAAGTPALAVRCDVTREEEVEATVERVCAELGAVDILINNSGASWSAPAAEMPAGRFEEVLAVNVLGTFLMSKAVARRRISSGGGGVIVNIASVAAFKGAQPGYIDAVGYNASKGGVVALTRGLAGSWAEKGIRVNAIAPGWFPTRMSSPILAARGDELLAGIPLGRFGSGEDIGGVAIFLCSPAAGYMTGQTILVDGGQELW